MITVRRLADGEVVREAVFARSETLVLGRSPEADFPLADETVSRVHARLRRDEADTLWLEDAGSRNGIVVDGERVERARVPVPGALRCLLGAVEIEVALASPDATLEWRLETGRPRETSLLSTLAYWVLGVAAIVGGSVLAPAFWSPWQKERLTGAVQAATVSAVALPVVAFVLVGLLRIARRRARLADTLRALAIVLGVGLLVSLLSLAVPYVGRPDTQGVLLAVLRMPAMVFAVAYLASIARKGPGRRYFLGWAGAATLVLVAFSVVGEMANRQAGVPEARYEMAVPLGGYSGPRGELPAYFDAVRRDFKEAQREAAEEDRRTRAPSAPAR